jgi:hypothetical protein
VEAFRSRVVLSARGPLSGNHRRSLLSSAKAMHEVLLSDSVPAYPLIRERGYFVVFTKVPNGLGRYVGIICSNSCYDRVLDLRNESMGYHKAGVSGENVRANVLKEGTRLLQSVEQMLQSQPRE